MRVSIPLAPDSNPAVRPRPVQPHGVRWCPAVQCCDRCAATAERLCSAACARMPKMHRCAPLRSRRGLCCGAPDRLAHRPIHEALAAADAAHGSKRGAGPAAWIARIARREALEQGLGQAPVEHAAFQALRWFGGFALLFQSAKIPQTAATLQCFACLLQISHGVILGATGGGIDLFQSRRRDDEGAACCSAW